MDALTLLRAYLAGDETAIMSRAHVEFVIAEIERLYEWKSRAEDMDREKTTQLVNLRAELAAERERKESYMKGEITEYERAEKAEKRVSKLRDALEPFAKAAENFDDTIIKNAEEWFVYSGQQSHDETRGTITVGDLRRARAVLAETGGDNGNG
jgi:hypothetical protein